LNPNTKILRHDLTVIINGKTRHTTTDTTTPEPRPTRGRARLCLPVAPAGLHSAANLWALGDDCNEYAIRDHVQADLINHERSRNA
jgi:hypothetical protein